MPRVVQVSAKDLDWLRKNHQTQSYPAMAKRLGCCVDTLKRILVRESLQEFDGAKYQIKEKVDAAKLWTRPCMKCGQAEERPKFWYFCRSCRKRMGYIDE
jgi:hypothetical protein